MGSSGVVGFTRDRLGGCWVHLGWFSSLEFPLGVDGFIRGSWIHSGTPWGYLVHPGSLGSLRFALGVAGFFRAGWVDTGSPLGSMGSSGVVGFTGVRPGGRWVHSGSP